MNGLSTTSRAPKSTAQAGGKGASETLSEIWRALETLTDPEIPVVSLREMGILRDVRGDALHGFEVVITPTYSGCPAMEQIHDDVLATMQMPTAGGFITTGKQQVHSEHLTFLLEEMQSLARRHPEGVW